MAVDPELSLQGPGCDTNIVGLSPEDAVHVIALTVAPFQEFLMESPDSVAPALL